MHPMHPIAPLSHLIKNLLYTNFLRPENLKHKLCSLTAFLQQIKMAILF